MEMLSDMSLDDSSKEVEMCEVKVQGVIKEANMETDVCIFHFKSYNIPRAKCEGVELYLLETRV